MTIKNAAPVVEDEEPWTAAELSIAEAKLSARVQELRSELESVAAQAGDLASETLTEGALDVADQGSNSEIRDHEIQLAEHLTELLQQTEHALARIADGSYPFCESCGDAIGVSRLEAFPRATMCIPCKQLLAAR